MTKLINIEVKDKRQKKWQAQTFMGMIGAFISASNWAHRGLRAMPNFKFDGLPLPILSVGIPNSRTLERIASKKRSRQLKRSRINKRGY